MPKGHLKLHMFETKLCQFCLHHVYGILLLLTTPAVTTNLYYLNDYKSFPLWFFAPDLTPFEFILSIDARMFLLKLRKSNQVTPLFNSFHWFPVSFSRSLSSYYNLWDYTIWLCITSLVSSLPSLLLGPSTSATFNFFSLNIPRVLQPQGLCTCFHSLVSLNPLVYIDDLFTAFTLHLSELKILLIADSK